MGVGGELETRSPAKRVNSLSWEREETGRSREVGRERRGEERAGPNIRGHTQRGPESLHVSQCPEKTVNSLILFAWWQCT